MSLEDSLLFRYNLCHIRDLRLLYFYSPSDASSFANFSSSDTISTADGSYESSESSSTITSGCDFILSEGGAVPISFGLSILDSSFSLYSGSDKENVILFATSSGFSSGLSLN